MYRTAFNAMVLFSILVMIPELAGYSFSAVNAAMLAANTSAVMRMSIANHGAVSMAQAPKKKGGDDDVMPHQARLHPRKQTV
jgi:hypothetical protein